MLESLREAGATATFFLAGEQVERRPSLAAEIVAAGHRVELHCHRHRSQLRLTPRPDTRRRRPRPGGDRGRDRPGDPRLPAALRDLQRPGPARGAAARLASGPLVAMGKGLGPARNGGVDRPSRDGRCPRRRHRASSRRRLLQRRRLLDAHRGGASADTRGTRRPRIEGRLAANAERAVPVSTGRSRRTLRRAFSPSCSAACAGPGRRSPWA